VGIVEDHRHAVFAEDHVLFEEVGALPVGQGLGCERVFRQVAAGAAMRDDQRTRLRGEGRKRQEQQGEQEPGHGVVLMCKGAEVQR